MSTLGATIERCTTQALRSLLGLAITALGGYVIVRGAHADAIALTNALVGSPMIGFGCYLMAPGKTGEGVDFLIDKVRRYRGDAPLGHGDATAAHDEPHVDVPTFPTRPG